MNDRGASAGPWIMAGLAFGLPALYFVRVLSLTWTGYHTAIVLAIGGACAWRFAHVFGIGAEHALHNRRDRDRARTIELQARAQPILTDDSRGELWRAQAERTRVEAEVLRAGKGAEATRPPVPVRVWSDGFEDEGGYDDGDT